MPPNCTFMNSALGHHGYYKNFQIPHLVALHIPSKQRHILYHHLLRPEGWYCTTVLYIVAYFMFPRITCWMRIFSFGSRRGRAGHAMLVHQGKLMVSITYKIRVTNKKSIRITVSMQLTYLISLVSIFMVSICFVLLCLSILSPVFAIAMLRISMAHLKEWNFPE